MPALYTNMMTSMLLSLENFLTPKTQFYLYISPPISLSLSLSLSIYLYLSLSLVIYTQNITPPCLLISLLQNLFISPNNKSNSNIFIFVKILYVTFIYNPH